MRDTRPLLTPSLTARSARVIFMESSRSSTISRKSSAILEAILRGSTRVQ